MAARRTLPDTHARVTANAQQFISEFQRADNASRRSAASIDRELSKLQSSLKNKFSASDIGKDALKFLGLGSGFAVADLAFSKVADIFRDADEAAKDAADSIATLNAEWRKLSQKIEESAISRMSPASAIEARKRQLEEVTKSIADMQQRTALLNSDLARVGAAPFGTIAGTAFDPTQGRYGSWKSMKSVGDDISGEIDNLSKELAAAQERRLELQQQIDEARTKMVEREKRDLQEVTKLEVERWSAMEQNALKALDAVPESAFEARRDAIEDMFWGGKIGAEAADKAIANLDRDYAAFVERQKRDLQDVTKLEVERWDDMAKAAEDAISRISNLGQRRDAIDDAFWGGKISAEQADKLIGDLDKVKEKASEFDREMAAMWNNVSDRAGEAFADMVLTGEASFSKLADIAARSILEIVARMAIINPLINAIFGFEGSSALPAFYGAGAHRARGGAVEPGYTYRINEDGQEFFKPSVGGTIMPVGASKGLREKRAGNTYIIDARGADQGAVARIEQALMMLAGPGVVEQRAIYGVRDAMNRGSF